jgi:hypothetical protein
MVGTLNKDSNMTPIQRAKGLVTIDGSDTPLQSPQSVTSATEVALKAPEYAVAAFLYTNQDIWIDGATGVSDSQGFFLVSGSYVQIDVEAGRTLYLKAAGTTATVSFAFQIIPN